jgi:hypothetical protein
VEVTASDGQAASVRSFLVSVTPNSAPVFGTVGDVTLSATQAQAQAPATVTLSASDPDGDAIQFSGRTLSWNVPYQLDQNLGLWYHSGYQYNSRGLGEKWMQSARGYWYCILPNGELRRWVGTVSGTLSAANLVAKLNNGIWQDPSLLWNAAVPTAPAATLQFSGNQLTITPPAGYSGVFRVEVTASDGQASAVQTFVVTVTSATASSAAAGTGTSVYQASQLAANSLTSRNPEGLFLFANDVTDQTREDTAATPQQQWKAAVNSYFAASSGNETAAERSFGPSTPTTWGRAAAISLLEPDLLDADLWSLFKSKP